MPDQTQQAVPLTAEDYGQLHQMQMSTDPGLRAQAGALAKKLTPAEQHEFFTYQQQANKAAGVSELHRADNQVGGLPPELAAVAAVPVARAAMGSGLTAVQRMLGAAKGAATQAAPIVKYEASKAALQKIGVPAPLATVAAMAIAGYSPGGKGAAASVPATAAAPEAAAAATAVPTETEATIAALRKQGVGEASIQKTFGTGAGASVAPPAVGTASVPKTAPIVSQAPASAAVVPFSPQKALNEMAIQARRAKVTLTDADYEAGSALVKKGLSPAQAVDAVAGLKTNPNVIVTPDHAEAYLALRRQGLDQKLATKAVEEMRDFAEKFNLKTPSEVKAHVDDRNLTNRWSK